MEFKFEVNQKYTLVAIGEIRATIKNEFVIIRFDEAKQRYVFRIKGKKKEYYVPIDIDEHLLFKGHDLPILVDTETGCFQSNARFNFVTDDTAALRSFIEANCLNLTAEKRQFIMFSGTKRNDPESRKCRPLFK